MLFAANFLASTKKTKYKTTHATTHQQLKDTITQKTKNQVRLTRYNIFTWAILIITKWSQNSKKAASHNYMYVSNLETSCPSVSRVVPDQNRCAQMLTARHWSGFLSNFAAPTAHCDLSGLWFSSVKHVTRCSVAKMSVAAASCALLSLISSSYNVNAFKHTATPTSVAQRWARLVLGWVTVFGRVYHLGM